MLSILVLNVTSAFFCSSGHRFQLKKMELLRKHVVTAKQLQAESFPITTTKNEEGVIIRVLLKAFSILTV